MLITWRVYLKTSDTYLAYLIPLQDWRHRNKSNWVILLSAFTVLCPDAPPSHTHTKKGDQKSPVIVLNLQDIIWGLKNYNLGEGGSAVSVSVFLGRQGK
jgi:hypothetical protein